MRERQGGGGAATEARSLRVRGVVQGVGFRPFAYRLAGELGLAGWVRNDGEGVEIHLEGSPAALDRFATELASRPPPAARVAGITAAPAAVAGHDAFAIRESGSSGRPTARISADLPVCDACLAELFDPADRRHGYPYLNCTDCGPRYSILLALPYDRPHTTMREWALCAPCAAEYDDPGDRRFHAQPTACPACGPHYRLAAGADGLSGDREAIAEAARRLAAGEVLAIKGLGGYHLACDAADATAVAALRHRKFRKEKPFALMAADLETARGLVELAPQSEALLTSAARPIVLAPARRELAGVAPGHQDLGVMLPYAPLHHLLFAAGAPPVLVMTSANRSSEPIAYRDDEARERLAGIADAFLTGERPIARRVDDSVARVGPLGPAVLRRARGYAPAVVARLPAGPPLLALGADLKNTVTLVVDGEAVMSQHLGDLAHWPAFETFRDTVEDLLAMYEVDRDGLTVAHDLHPEYASTRHAGEVAGRSVAVQHHRAHLASVLAERGALAERVVGVAFDGTGYGDDGAIWGGELFVGSVADGLDRAAHLRQAALPGGDAAARHPVQAAAGFLGDLGDLPDLAAPPFAFPERWAQARALLASGVRTFPTTSVGRLFDTAAALCGFTRAITYEGQAAIWLENLARGAEEAEPLPLPFTPRGDGPGELDFRPALAALVAGRRHGEDPARLARGFHSGLAHATAEAARHLAREHGLATVVLSGGVFQNRLLLAELAGRLEAAGLAVWANREVPPNDGGISLGQAAMTAAAR